MRVLIIREAVFIGSAVCRCLLDKSDANVVDFDKLCHGFLAYKPDARECSDEGFGLVSKMAGTVL